MIISRKISCQIWSKVFLGTPRDPRQYVVYHFSGRHRYHSDHSGGVCSVGCLVLSPLNTVVLKTRHEMKMQEAITSAINQGDNMLDLYRECDVIEEKLLEYLQHETGSCQALVPSPKTSPHRPRPKPKAVQNQNPSPIGTGAYTKITWATTTTTHP